jgi:hypothetical protein
MCLIIRVVPTLRSPIHRRVARLGRGSWLVCAWALAACSRTSSPATTSNSPDNGGTRDASANDQERRDAASAADAATQQNCVQTQIPSLCVPIVRCSACDTGLCGEVPQLGGCDMEGAVCLGACDVPCTCRDSFWHCDFPEGQPCHHATCDYPQNYGGGGVDSFQCCARDAGSATWGRGGCGTP